MSNISACIVTFNRKSELLRCLEHVINQSVRLDNVIIFDNASTDGTVATLIKKFDAKIALNSLNDLHQLTEVKGTKIWIIRSTSNTGGAGGFHEAVKLARENFITDYYWLMDDDGYPERNCLKEILDYAEEYQHDYVMPISIDIDNHNKLSWATRKMDGIKTEYYNELIDSWGKVMNYITPFNGSLLTKSCIDKVGYVNKDFFIWGDEYEHYWRCREVKIDPVTITNALFYHPAMKLPLVSTFFGLFKVPFSDSKLRMVCLVRNYTYIYKKHDHSIKIPIKFFIYSWFFLVTRKLDFENFKLYVKCVYDGLREDFTRHNQYLK